MRKQPPLPPIAAALLSDANNSPSHSAYSTHEFTALSSRRSSSPTKSSTTLPVDIQVETIIAVGLACLGLVLGSPSLKPISWSTWAGKIEKGDKEAGFNPFAGLEERVGFMDIRVCIAFVMA
jgi:membrane magnesium transporter 1